MTSLRSRIAGGLRGLLIGDALGVPFEFYRASELPPKETIDFDLPEGFRRAHPGAPAYAWSDDGAQALCLLESLLAHDGLELEDFANRLRNWANVGYCAVDFEVFDIGNQTSVALSRLEKGVPIEDAAPRDLQANGNGSLMRVLPVALWHRGADADLVGLAHRQSHVTHAHERSKVCCALYSLLAKRLLQGLPVKESWDAAVAFLRSHYRGEYEHQLTLVLAELQTRKPSGGGYVVDTLAGALWALQQPDYAAVVRAAISLGNDTDTTAAVAGGLAGIVHGIEGIPSAWLDRLAGADLVASAEERLLGSLSL